MVHRRCSIPNLSGQTVDRGRIVLLTLIGSGVHGAVYHATQATYTSLPPPRFAVKCVAKPDLNSPKAKWSAREMALHAIVSSHPNVVTLYSAFEENNFNFLVLEPFPTDMFTAMTQRLVYHRDDQLIKRAFIGLIDAVHFCHENGVFHRDLKPENVLCSWDGSEVRLADFGLATADRFSKSFRVGTSPYMSPECVGELSAFNQYSTRGADVWALGVILVNMIAGRNPWSWATTRDDCFLSYLHDQGKFLRQILPISKSANILLQRVFDVNAPSRITLPTLRSAIIRIDTFQMSEEDLTQASSTVRRAARYHAGPGPLADHHQSGSDDQVTITGAERPSPADAKAAASTCSPRPEMMQQASVDVTEADVSEDSDYEGQNDAPKRLVALNMSPASSSSTADSDGPITPETHAVDPVVAVPDLTENESMGESVIKGPIEASPAEAGKKRQGRAKLLMDAVSRLKVVTI